MKRLDWLDLGYTGLATVEGQGTRVEWRLLEIVVYGPHIGWWPKDGMTAFPEATDPEQAHVVVEISVRTGDGCADFSWAAGEATHTCSCGDTRNLAEALMRVHELTDQVAAERVSTP